MKTKTKKPQGEVRTNGFRTFDTEVMNVLDCVSPNTERLYRKLFQRVNLQRGDRKAFPGWQTLQLDCGWENSPATLSRAIREGEHFRLFSIVRPTKAEALREKVTNAYYLTPSNQLPQEQELEKLLSQWKQFKAGESLKEKGRKARKLLSQEKEATTKVIVGYSQGDSELLSQRKTNKDEFNQDEYNKDEFNQDEEKFFEKESELDQDEISENYPAQATPDETDPASRDGEEARIAIQDVPVEKVPETEEEQEEDDLPEIKKDPEIKHPAGLSTSPVAPTPSSAPPLPPKMMTSEELEIAKQQVKERGHRERERQDTDRQKEWERYEMALRTPYSVDQDFRPMFDQFHYLHDREKQSAALEEAVQEWEKARRFAAMEVTA